MFLHVAVVVIIGENNSMFNSLLLLEIDYFRYLS